MSGEKNSSLFLRLERNLKRYQVLFSLAIPITISVVAVVLSFNANRIARSELEERKVPFWDYKVIRDEGGEFGALQIISLKPEIRLEEFEVLAVFGKSEMESFGSKKDILNLYSLESRLVEYRNSIYTYDLNVGEVFPIIIKEQETFPVVFKIKYVVNNNVEYEYLLYRLNIGFFNNTVARVNSLSLVQKLAKKDADVLGDMRNYIDKTQCIGKLGHYDSLELLEEVKRKDSTVANYILWSLSYGKRSFRKVVYVNASSNEIVDEKEIAVPYLLLDSNIYRNANRIKDSLAISTEDSKVIALSSRRIDSFLTVNKYCFNPNSNCLEESTWLKAETFHAWESLIREEIIRIWMYYYPTYK